MTAPNLCIISMKIPQETKIKCMSLRYGTRNLNSNCYQINVHFDHKKLFKDIF